MANWVKLPNGKFAGSKGGGGGSGGGSITGKTSGGAALGGRRGIIARARLAKAKRELQSWRSDVRILRAEQGPKRVGGKVQSDADYAANRRSLLKRIARRRRAIKAHEREVARIEKRGLQPVKIERKKGPFATRSEYAKAARKYLRQSREARVDNAASALNRAKQDNAARRTRITEALKRFGKLKNAPPSVTRSIPEGVSARKLSKLRLALKNRQRELARVKG